MPTQDEASPAPAWPAFMGLALGGAGIYSAWLLIRFVTEARRVGFGYAQLAFFCLLAIPQLIVFYWAGRGLRSGRANRGRPSWKLYVPFALGMISPATEMHVIPFAAWLAMDGTHMTPGNLGALRSALSLYYGDHGRVYPQDIQMLSPKYLQGPLPVYTLQHGKTSVAAPLSTEDYRAGRFSDAGGWAYVNSGPDAGVIVVNCTHASPKGKAWNAY